jgi:acetyl-CoA acetyltransferase family protein
VTVSARSVQIVDAVRTPGGRRNGTLSGWHPVDLLAEVLKALIERTGLNPEEIDDVVTGCVVPVGAQAFNVGRSAVLAAGFPESVPAVTIDRQCGSSLQAIHFAAQGILAGAYDVAIAAGVECMSVVRMDAHIAHPEHGEPFGPTVRARYADREYDGHVGLMHQGIVAEYLADRWGFSRQQLDEYGLRSQERAATAWAEGRFAREVVSVRERRLDPGTREVCEGEVMLVDEGIRTTSLEALAALKPSFKEGGKVTAGNSSQITDGAAAVLLMSAAKAKTLGLQPLAGIVDFAVVGVDPVEMLTGPIPATRKVLARAGLSLEDIDAFEVNEAFASVVLAWEAEIHPDMDKVNIHGGAIALGHPLGASGAMRCATLLNVLEAKSGRYGLQTVCEGGGMANALIIERFS